MSLKKKYGWIIGSVFFLLGIGVTGCGYRFAGSGSYPGGVKTIFVAIFENRTIETGIEKIFTDDLVDEFIRKGEGTLSWRKSQADAVLFGVIGLMRIDTVFHTGSDTSDEREVTIGVSFRLKDQHNKILWASVVSERQTYAVGSGKQETEQNRSDAILVLSKRIAEKAYNRLTADF